jgi:hypothetical protein
MPSDNFCNGCTHLKGEYKGIHAIYVVHCARLGFNISGTLERLDKCKCDNLKEVSHDQEKDQSGISQG